MARHIVADEFLDLIASLRNDKSIDNQTLSLFVKYRRRFLEFMMIDRPMNEIIDESKSHDKVYVVRQYRGERRLVVACGNGPLLFDDTDEYPVGQDENYEEYRDEHLHVGEYTINGILGMNPSIIGGFGQTDLRSLLPQECFEEIEFEGGGEEEERWTISNILWLLKEGGQVKLTGGEDCVWNILVKKDGQLFTEMEHEELPPKGSRVVAIAHSFDFSPKREETPDGQTGFGFSFKRDNTDDTKPKQSSPVSDDQVEHGFSRSTPRTSTPFGMSLSIPKTTMFKRCWGPPRVHCINTVLNDVSHALRANWGGEKTYGDVLAEHWKKEYLKWHKDELSPALLKIIDTVERRIREKVSIYLPVWPDEEED